MFVAAEDTLGLDCYFHLFFFVLFKIRPKWLKMEAKISIGNAHTACLKRLFISPSGKAIKNVIMMSKSSMYHLKDKVQSSIVIIIVAVTMHAISRNREGSSHWNSLLQ